MHHGDFDLTHAKKAEPVPPELNIIPEVDNDLDVTGEMERNKFNANIGKEEGSAKKDRIASFKPYNYPTESIEEKKEVVNAISAQSSAPMRNEGLRQDYKIRSNFF